MCMSAARLHKGATEVEIFGVTAMQYLRQRLMLGRLARSSNSMTLSAEMRLSTERSLLQRISVQLRRNERFVRRAHSILAPYSDAVALFLSFPRARRCSF